MHEYYIYFVMVVINIIYIYIFKKCKNLTINVDCQEKNFYVVLKEPSKILPHTSIVDDILFFCGKNNTHLITIKFIKDYNQTIINLVDENGLIHKSVLGGTLLLQSCDGKWSLVSIIEEPPVPIYITPTEIPTEYIIQGYESVIYFTKGNNKDMLFKLPDPCIMNGRNIIIKTLTEAPFTIEYSFTYKCEIIYSYMVETTCVTSYGDQPHIFTLVPDCINDTWIII